MTPRTVSFRLPPHEREAMRGLMDAGLIPPKPQSFGEAFRASLTDEQREVIDDMAALPAWERTAMLRHAHEYFGRLDDDGRNTIPVIDSLRSIHEHMNDHDELCDNLFHSTDGE